MLAHFFNREILLVLIFFQVFAADSNNNTNRVVKGYRCRLRNHPYMVAILKANYWSWSLIHQCGGTILSPYWVVTAAHCLKRKDCPPNYFTVFAGVEIASINSNLNKYAQRSRVKKCFTLYEDEATSKDIALLRLVKPIHHSHNVKYVRLATNNDTKVEEACKKSGVVMGWGDQYAKDEFGESIYEKPNYDPYLRCLNTPILPYKVCKERLVEHRALSIHSFCTYTSGKDTCQRDSGGPFMCNGIQYGIVSWGVGCAHEDYPAVYTKVADFEEFIKNTLEKNTTAKFNISKLLLFSLFIVSLLWNYFTK